MATISFESYVNTSLKAINNCELEAEFTFLMPKVYSAYVKIYGAMKTVAKDKTLDATEARTLKKVLNELKSTLNLSTKDLSVLNEPFYSNLLHLSEYFKKGSSISTKISKMKYEVPNYSFRILELVSGGNSPLEATVLAASESTPSGINQKDLYNDMMLQCLKRVEGIKQSCIKVQQQRDVSMTANQDSKSAIDNAAKEKLDKSKPGGTNPSPIR